MSRLWLLTIPLLLVSQSVSAMTATGRGALTLASLVADLSPTNRARDRTALRQMFNRHAAVPFATGAKDRGAGSDSVICRAPPKAWIGLHRRV